MNQAVFERFLVGEDGSSQAELAGVFGILLAPDLLTRNSRRNSHSQPSSRHVNSEWRHGAPRLARQIARHGGPQPRP